jgi:hypothetical protein
MDDLLLRQVLESDQVESPASGSGLTDENG